MKKFVIVGGGTAGYISAATLISIYPDATITLIESNTIGTIGVGESTTPAILDFLSIANIDIADFLKETGSTIKIGIKFENWYRTNESYFHSFDLVRDPRLLNVSWGIDHLHYFINNDHPYSVMEKQNLVPIDQTGKLSGTHALHINAVKFVEYVRKKFKDRINIIEAVVNDVQLDQKGISSIILDNGTSLTADIFFDCTGFKRKLHTAVGSKWHSLKELLPVDRAIPCQFDWATPMNTTHASAQEHGWIWQVPLTERIGSGYVYSSEFAKNPEDEFIKFIKEKYDRKVEINKIIEFESGYIKNPWKNNVVCVGLSSGFLEPLESTSIHMIIHQILAFTHLYDGSITARVENLYNMYMQDMFEETAAFIKLHYLGTPYNNEFWKYMNSNIGSNRLENLLELWKNHVPSPDHIGQNKNELVGYRLFAIPAWLQVMQGMKKLKKENIERFINFNRLDKFEKDFSNLITQKEFLNSLK
jgi:tryptophan 7-halogenase